MTVPHHEPEQSKLIEQFGEQMTGRARRRWPEGRIGPNDDGELVFAMAADPKHGVVHIDFGKPVAWIALDKESAEKLIAMLTEKLFELRGITA